MMDLYCVWAAALFMTSRILGFSLFAKIRNRGHFDFAAFKAFDVAYIREEFQHRDDHHVPGIITGVLNALAWLCLAIPLLQVVWIQCSLNSNTAATGKLPHHLLGVHMATVVMIIGGVISEFLSHLLFIGASETALWISKDFNLDFWALPNAEDDATATVDAIGWRALEATYFVMRGTLLWIDAAEWIFLSITFVLIYTSIVLTPGPRTFSGKWAAMGFVLGVLAFVDFLFNILRLKDWKSFAMLAGFISLFNAVLGMPIWLLWLGRQLSVAKTNAKLMPPLVAGNGVAHTENGDTSPQSTNGSHEGNELS